MLILRNLGRAMGLNRLAASLFGAGGYEDRFQKVMLGAIRQGDVIWDVGANVGLYSRKFSDISGSSGKVFAYEPSLANLQRLNEAVATLANVTVMPVALGEGEDVVVFEQGKDPLGATSRIVDKAAGESAGQVEIRITSGDLLISSGAVAIPNVIKIDTEGFELDVLLGLRQTLLDKRLRVLCIEMHFGLLQERGLPNAPSDIEKLLVSSGFSLAWPDASHIVAARIT
ncbi:MAG: FkbM family methyltransferase [Proteobacteria bacterium]|nr:FkbM family methyltransferase [Pseudomonadota bacterium]